MTNDQVAIFVILAVTMALFVWNHWRYDVVAGCALMAVLVISQALQSSGVVSLFLKYLGIFRGGRHSQLAANCGTTALLSAFMNNIGALALMLPITMRDARKAKRAASSLLMPLSFASLLGGLVPLIGTPPNIIIATFRAEQTGQPFGMFDFTPVGLAVALAGLLFLVFASKFLLPSKKQKEAGSQFQMAKYLTEIAIPDTSELIGKTVRELEEMCDNEASVIAIVRDEIRSLAPRGSEPIHVGDVLILQGDGEALQPLFEDTSLVHAGAEITDSMWQGSPDVRVIEAVVMPNSMIGGIAMRAVKMHERYGVNLLAVARERHPSQARLKRIRFKTGDVLLLQGEREALAELCANLGCLAIKNRGIEITPKRSALLTPAVFLAGILATAFGLLPVQIAFTTVVGVLVLFKAISLREAYRSIEWPVIVLLGFLIPVGEALRTTGATEQIA